MELDAQKKEGMSILTLPQFKHIGLWGYLPTTITQRFLSFSANG